MYSVIKGVCLFGSIVILMPIVFFILIVSVGKFFVLKIDSTSWLARTQVRWVRAIADKFV